jgi:hypothetical protein
MPNLSMRDEKGRPNLRAFENYGFIYGLSLGGVVGVLVAGPYFGEWPLAACLGTIVGCGIGAGVVGYLAVAMVYGSAASGFGAASDANESSATGDSDDGGDVPRGGSGGD